LLKIVSFATANRSKAVKSVEENND